MTWLQNILYGFLSGMAEILPISSRAHGILLLKIFGASGSSDLMLLLMHLGILLALYKTCHPQLTRINRALALARVPKKRRRRPLDTRSLMDFRLLRTMVIPVIPAFFLYNATTDLVSHTWSIALFLILNGLILYLPQFLPSGNKDSRNMSRVDGLLIGLGGALSVLPGISGIGAMVSIGSVCGVDKKYALENAMAVGIVISACTVVCDALRIISGGLEGLTFSIVLAYLCAALASFFGGLLGVKLLRSIVEEHGFTVFAFYCWGLALFTFFLSLVA